jgi:crotonobetainyl-CoA:carnitine CoA-transferase CaiB-like acyl-CoA transferase
VRDLRVLELAGSVAGAYCGRLLATTGADVVLVEPPDGAPTRSRGPWLTTSAGARVSATHEYLDAGKRSVVLAPDDAAFDDAVRWADVVVSSGDGEPATALALHDRIAAADASTVHVVLSGFGLTGPYASWRHSPLVDWAAGGYAYITGEPDREPLQGGGPWAAYLHGVWAAVGAAAAAMHAARTGEGQLVDVGAMEAVAAGHQWTLTMYTHTGGVKRRWGRRFGESFHPMGLYQAADGGWFSVGAASRDQWDHFCITTDAVELMADEALYAAAERFERADDIDAAIAPWLAAHTAAEAVEALQESRVPASLALDFTQVLESEQVRARDALDARPDLGPTVTGPGRPFRIGAPAPLAPPSAVGADTASFLATLDEDRDVDDRTLPAIDLTATRLLEFGIAWAGPLAARTLGDLGVDVVKVEHPLSRGFGAGSGVVENSTWRWGDLAPPAIRAEIFPLTEPGERRWNRMGTWNKMNRSKRSLCLDAKPADGAAVLDALIADADLFVHNMTPRGAGSLGVAPERLAALNPHIASVAMTGYGETGPMSTHSSYGPMLEAYAGFAEATGYIGDPPLRIGIAFPDAVGGLHGAYALLAALWERELTGQAVHVDLSQLETLMSFAGEAFIAASADGVSPPRHGNRSADHAPQGIYRCDGDDAWVAVTVQGDAEWAALLQLFGDPDLVDLADADLAARTAAHDRIDSALARWTRTRAPLVAAKELQAYGIVAAPTFTNRDLVLDDHLAARGFIVSWDHPDVGVQRYPGFPIHFARTPVTVRPTPTLGADNRDILRELGCTDDQIDALEAAGVIAVAPSV